MKPFEEVHELRNKLISIISNGEFDRRKDEYFQLYYRVCRTECQLERIVSAALHMVDAAEAAQHNDYVLRQAYNRLLYEVRTAREDEAA